MAKQRGDAVTVGVTGHRPNRCPEHNWPRIREQLDRVLLRLARGAKTRPTLVSGLAEGADRLAAYSALGQGYALDAILAFHRSRFEEDFPSPSSKGEFRALLSAARRIREPGRRWHLGRPSSDGYARMGAAMLTRVNVLLAIWDGEGSQGRGGTIDVMLDARRQGATVYWIHATKERPVRRLPPLAHPERSAGRGSARGTRA